MPYAIVVVPSAQRALQQIEKRDQKRIVARIDALAQDPHPAGARKIQGGTDEFRIRVGGYRVIYSVSDTTITVVVIRVGHRRDLYR
ncbi:MAG: type II toxin-antitoxin system RelE/ParE family toxin [Gemmatimonadaceae bacterium]